MTCQLPDVRPVGVSSSSESSSDARFTRFGRIGMGGGPMRVLAVTSAGASVPRSLSSGMGIGRGTGGGALRCGGTWGPDRDGDGVADDGFEEIGGGGIRLLRGLGTTGGWTTRKPSANGSVTAGLRS